MSKVPLLPYSPPEEDALLLEVERIESLLESATRPRPHRHAFYAIFWVTAIF